MIVRQRGHKWQAEVCWQNERFRRTFDTKEAAEYYNLIALIALRAGEPIPDKTDFSSYELAWIIHKYRNIIWPDNPDRPKDSLARLYGFFGPACHIQNISTKRLLEFKIHLKGLGLASGTVNRKYAVISKVLKFAHRMEWIDKMPFIDRDKEPIGLKRYLTQVEETEILQLFHRWGCHHFAEYTNFLLYTGARFSEPLHLTKNHVISYENSGLQRAVIFPKTKNGHPRTIPLTKKAEEALDYFLSKGDKYIFSSVKYNSYRHVWDRVREHMGHANDRLFTPHILRHTCASRLVQSGVDLKRVQEWMGHTTFHTTLRYAHLAPRDLEVAAAALQKFGD